MLAWRGSHVAVSWNPDGKFLATAMQENELHAWRLTTGADMRMSGYRAKPSSLSWAANGRFLATSGAEAIIVWRFDGEGPAGRGPIELCGSAGALVTTVAFHRREAVVAAGFEDGALSIGDVGKGTGFSLQRVGEGAVTGLAWSPDGRWLAAGTEAGDATLTDVG